MADDQHSAHTPGPRCPEGSAHGSGVQAERGEAVRCGDHHLGGGTLDLIPDLRHNSALNPFVFSEALVGSK
jgi:hypothetical protein